MTDPRITATLVWWQARADNLEGSDPCADCGHPFRSHTGGHEPYYSCQVIVSESLGFDMTCDCCRYAAEDDAS